MNVALSQLLARVFGELGWLELGRTPTLLGQTWDGRPGDRQASDEPCWLRQALNSDRREALSLTATGRATLSRLVSSGCSLRAAWPRNSHTSVETWIGKRLFFSHAKNFEDSTNFATIVSSQLGRHGRWLPEWPRLVDASLRNVSQQRARLLVAPKTTLFEAVLRFARRAHLPIVRLEIDVHSSPVDWLKKQLIRNSIAGLEESDQLVEWLSISPEIEAHATMIDGPLQDRMAISLSDRIYLLSMRSGGRIERLLLQRLQDAQFPTGSVFVRLPHVTSQPTSGQFQPPHRVAQVRLLDEGAVGWILLHESTPARPWLINCRRSPHSVAPRRGVQQIVSPVPTWWRELGGGDDWPYLSHCTRGTSGPLPEESVERYHDRLWLAGEHLDLCPLDTLTSICRQRCCDPRR